MKKIPLANGLYSATTTNKVYSLADYVTITFSSQGGSGAYFLNQLFNLNLDYYYRSSTTGDQTITFDFEPIVNQMIHTFRIYSNVAIEPSTDYRLVASNDLTHWIPLTDWVINTPEMGFSLMREHHVRCFGYRYVRIELRPKDKEKANLINVEVYIADSFFLMQDGEELKTWHIEETSQTCQWKTIGQAPATPELFLIHGFHSFPKDQNLFHQLRSEEPELLAYVKEDGVQKETEVSPFKITELTKGIIKEYVLDLKNNERVVQLQRK